MFEPFGQSKNLRLLRFRSLLVAVHWDAFDIEQFRAISNACEKIVKQHQQVSSLVFMQGNFSLMVDGDARREGAMLTKQWAPTNTGQALVLPAEGFKASIARSVLTGVNLLARSTVPQKIFQDSQEAVQWVTGLPGQPTEIALPGASLWDELRPELERLDAERKTAPRAHSGA